MPWGIGNVPRPGSRPASKPVLYLDVDGVLNPASPPERSDFTRHTFDAVSASVSSTHGAWLRELADRYELVWATAWEDLANEHLAPLLGLPGLPVVRFSAYERRPGDPCFRIVELFEMSKWAPILRHADGRAFAWLDDVIPARVRRHAWPYRKILLVGVDPAEGLARRHVDRLLSWPPAAP